MRVNSYSIRGVVPHGKQSEDSWQKEGRLSTRFREEPCWHCSTKPWQLHERPREILCMKPRKVWKRVVLTVQHKASKVTRKTWRRVTMIELHGAVRVTGRTLRKVVHETAKVTWRIQKRVVLTVQHKAAKVTRRTCRRVTEMKLAWLYPTKVKKARA